MGNDHCLALAQRRDRRDGRARRSRDPPPTTARRAPRRGTRRARRGAPRRLRGDLPHTPPRARPGLRRRGHRPVRHPRRDRRGRWRRSPPNANVSPGGGTPTRRCDLPDPTSPKGPRCCSTAPSSSSPECSPATPSPRRSPGSPRSRAPRWCSPRSGAPAASPSGSSRHLPEPADVLELDVTQPAHFAALAEELDRRWGRVDGVLHAVGFAPESCLGGGVLDAPWEDVSVALHVSAFSLKELAASLAPLMPRGSAVVGLDFDATQAFPQYDWMGVAKAALEATARYVARDLGPQGIRVNLVSAGPLRTLAARSIPGFADFEAAWGDAGAARLGRPGPRPRGQGVRGAAVGLVPRDDRRDRARRRWLPRHRRRRARPAAGGAGRGPSVTVEGGDTRFPRRGPRDPRDQRRTGRPAGAPTAVPLRGRGRGA